MSNYVDMLQAIIDRMSREGYVTDNAEDVHILAALKSHVANLKAVPPAVQPVKRSNILKQTDRFDIRRARVITRISDTPNAEAAFLALCYYSSFQFCLEALDDDSGHNCVIMASPGLAGEPDLNHDDESRLYNFVCGYVNARSGH